MRIGLIGAGNMASALLSGILAAKIVLPQDAMISDPDQKKLAFWKEQGVQTSVENQTVEEFADVVIFAVKPGIMPTVLKAIKGNPKKIYLSIAAGVTLQFLESQLGADMKIVRTMPNTPAQVSCGMTVVSPNPMMTKDDLKLVINLLEGVGSVLILPEKDLEIATAIHGSSPAYIYMMIDAMADAGVRHGLKKDDALLLAAKAVEGSAKMVLETGKHPEVLKDAVCSPGGTTIAAVCALEKSGFKSSVHAAVDACVKRNTEMKQ